jgi:hypothetical protein
MTGMNDAAQMLFLMISGHAIADQPLQSAFINRMKNRTMPGNRLWLQGMAIHGLIHGFFVAAITGVWWLGVAETILHAAIDDSKCAKRISHTTDQSLHIACKIIWMIIAINA